MTEYCDVTFATWKPDIEASAVVEYCFDDIEDTRKPHLKDHLSLLGSPHRLRVTKPRGHTTVENNHCVVVLQCKPVCGVEMVRLAVASEARTLELYDGRNGNYLSTVKGFKDPEDSEVDGSIVHYMCHCVFEEPMSSVKIKFLSLGMRENFDIARIKVVLQPSSSTSTESPRQLGQTIDLEKLRRHVDSMGDTVTDEAKAFLTTLEKFQKNKTGAVDDVRHMLTDKNLPASDGQTMAGITNLLAMFANMQGSTPMEGSALNNMMSQMMAMMSLKQEAAMRGDTGQAYKFLQAVCGEVTAQRAADQKQAEATTREEAEKGEAAAKSDAKSEAELESRVTKKVEEIVESRLSEVEQSIKEEVDHRMEEMETRMTNKLDAIFALLQNQKK